MADFSNISALNVDETTLAPYTFYDIPNEPVIWFAPATQENKPFWNEIQRIAAERAAQEIERSASGPLSDAELEAHRERDRQTIAQHAAKKWERVVDSKGEAVAFSTEECLGYFRAMPSYMFDPLRQWVQRQSNFIQRKAVAPGTAETLGND